MLSRSVISAVGAALLLFPGALAMICRNPGDNYYVKITPHGDMVRPAGDWSTVNEQSVIDLFHSYCGGARGGAAPSTNYMIAQKYGGSGPIAGSNIYAYVKCMCGNEDKSKAVFSDQLRWLQVMMDC